MAPPNLGAMRAVADRLDRLGLEYAFVGGSIVNLLLDYPELAPVRPTDDVDVIIETAEVEGYRRARVNCPRDGGTTNLPPFLWWSSGSRGHHGATAWGAPGALRVATQVVEHLVTTVSMRVRKDPHLPIRNQKVQSRRGGHVLSVRWSDHRANKSPYLLRDAKKPLRLHVCLRPCRRRSRAPRHLPAYPGGPFSCTCGHGIDILDRQCEWRSQGPVASRPEESESPRSLRDATKSLGLRFWVRLCWPRSGTSRHARTVIWHPAWGT
jgi:hypothetical protein